MLQNVTFIAILTKQKTLYTCVVYKVFRMNISPINSINFGWHIKTHTAVTEKAAENLKMLSKKEIKKLGKFSQMPDLIKEELKDLNSGHFYDVFSKDSSYGMMDEDTNNAFSKFLSHTQTALKQKDRDNFLRYVGYASHYLQDASTPPHAEHGNYFHKLYRLPMHMMFEKGKINGANSRLEEFAKGYTEENLSYPNLETLFHNTALHSVRKENKVGYDNIKDWKNIQQRSYNRSVNATKVYLEHMLKYLPEETAKKIDTVS